ncbi:MAG: right-handed parallel beta-helix repeat-containing protein [Pseudomonadota bacterium]
MGTNYTDYAQFDKATIKVSNSSQLNSAIKSLANSGGGTIKVDPNGGPYNMSVSGVGAKNSPVLIESAGSGKPIFKAITIKKSEFITIKGVKMDTSNLTNRATWEDDLRIENSNDIEVVDSTFIGSGQGYLSEGTSSDIRGTTGAYITRSDDVNLIGNSFSNYMYTIQFVDSKNIKFNENEVTQWQADAFHAGGIQNAQINDNYLHNPLGSTQKLAHTDFIQIRMANTNIDNRNIEIARNIMDTEGGPAAQGIHMGTGGTNGTNYNVSIHDNLIHSALPRGIGIDKTEGLQVYNNTLLWNKASDIEKYAGADLKSWDPRILITRSPKPVLEDNVASWMRINGTHQEDGGYQIQYNKPNAANHVDKHVTELNSSGNPNSYDLTFLKSSPIYGKVGASMSSDGITRPASDFEPVNPPADPVDPPADPVDPPADPVDPPSDPTGENFGPSVTLRLVNTYQDRAIEKIDDGESLKAAYLGKRAYTLLAEVSEDVGSVKMTFGDRVHTENQVPYALFGDKSGNFFGPKTPLFKGAGNYSAKIEVFSEPGGVNKIGESNFEFAVGVPYQPTAATTTQTLNGSVEGAGAEAASAAVSLEDIIPITEWLTDASVPADEDEEAADAAFLV